MTVIIDLLRSVAHLSTDSGNLLGEQWAPTSSNDFDERENILR